MRNDDHSSTLFIVCCCQNDEAEKSIKKGTNMYDANALREQKECPIERFILRELLKDENCY